MVAWQGRARHRADGPIYGLRIRCNDAPVSSGIIGYTSRPFQAASRRSDWIHMADKTIFKVIFMSQGQIYEIYARNVGHGAMFGFVEVEELVFGERSTVVVDPSEEKIKSEFTGVKRTYLPMHSIVRIDEVDKQGTSKISKAEGGNVAQFPMPVYTPGGENKP